MCLYAVCAPWSMQYVTLFWMECIDLCFSTRYHTYTRRPSLLPQEVTRKHCQYEVSEFLLSLQNLAFTMLVGNIVGSIRINTWLFTTHIDRPDLGGARRACSHEVWHSR